MKRVLLVIAALLSLTVLLAACKKERRYHLDPHRGKHTRDCGGDPRSHRAAPL
jgi:hypothetical protein